MLEGAAGVAATHGNGNVLTACGGLTLRQSGSSPDPRGNYGTHKPVKPCRQVAVASNVSTRPQVKRIVWEQRYQRLGK